MELAQDTVALLDIAYEFQANTEIGFLVVDRSSRVSGFR